MTLNILQAGQNYHIVGGSDRYMLELSRLLQAKGHTIVPFAADHKDNEPSEWSQYFAPRVNFEQPGFKDVVRFLYSNSAARSLEHLLSGVNIDIAHLHIYYGQLTSSILRPLKKYGVPIVQTLHEYKAVCPTYRMMVADKPCHACRGHNYWRALLHRCNRRSYARTGLSVLEAYLSRVMGAIRDIDHFIAVSQFQRNQLVEMGLPKDKVSVIHNFIDLAGFESSQDIGGYFLFFGRVEAVKGIYTLIEASSRLSEIPLLIVGNGAEIVSAREICDRSGYSNIKFCGFQSGDSLAQLIRGSICTITPSLWYETFGLTLLESFAYGRPVIASRIGGMTEVVSEGEDGFLVDSGNIDQLTERMQWMADNRGKAVEMGSAGKHKVAREFNSEDHYKKIAAVYENFC